MKMKVIFVSGAYSSDSDNQKFKNICRARQAAKMLWTMGFVVICPHTNSMFMDDGATTDAIFLQGALELLRRSDAIFMLYDWAQSKGARNENLEALRLNIPSFYQDDAQVSVRLNNFLHSETESDNNAQTKS